MLTNLICPVSNEKIDSNVSRLTIFISVILVCVFMFTGVAVPLYIAAIDYGIRAFTSGKFSPLRMIAALVVKGFGWQPKMIDKAPKVFASRLGFLCLLASSVLVNINMLTAAIGVAAMATSLFLLDASGIVCVGCLIYHHLVFPFFYRKVA